MTILIRAFFALAFYLEKEPNLRDILNGDGRIILQVFSKFRDIYIHASSRKIVISPPYFIEDLLPFNYSAGILDEKIDHLIFTTG